MTNIETILRHTAVLHARVLPGGGRSFENWLLEHGELFTAMLPVEPDRMMTPKQCFCNALDALEYDRVDRTRWFYTEGVFIVNNLPIPIHHAWLTNREGVVMDLTSRAAAEHGGQYWGIPYDFDFLMSAIIEQSHYGLFSDGVRYLPITQRPVGPERAWPLNRSEAA